MLLYADAPGRRTRQIVADLLFVVWIVVWIWAAQTVHEKTADLGDIGRQTEQASARLEDSLRDAGAALSGIPGVGDTIAAPFEKGARAAGDLAASGRDEVDATQTLAFWLGLAVGVSPIAILAGFYVPPRVRFVREAKSARRFLHAGGDPELFALRALLRVPPHQLGQVAPNPVAGWRERDPLVVARLADLGIRSCGLTPRQPPPQYPPPSWPATGAGPDTGTQIRPPSQ